MLLGHLVVCPARGTALEVRNDALMTGIVETLALHILTNVVWQHLQHECRQVPLWKATSVLSSHGIPESHVFEQLGARRTWRILTEGFAICAFKFLAPPCLSIISILLSLSPLRSSPKTRLLKVRRTVTFTWRTRHVHGADAIQGMSMRIPGKFLSLCRKPIQRKLACLDIMDNATIALVCSHEMVSEQLAPLLVFQHVTIPGRVGQFLTDLKTDRPVRRTPR